MSWNACLRNGFLEAIELRPRPARAVLAFGLIVIACALAAVAGADLPWSWKAPTALAVVGLASVEMSVHLGTRNGRRIAAAILGADGQWQLLTASGQTVSARLLRSWGVSLGPVLALEWRCVDGRCRQAWLLHRDIPEQTWRRLRVRLRLT